MSGLNIKLSLKKQLIYYLIVLKIIFILKRKFSFHFAPFNFTFFKSEMSLNFTTLISKIFVKSQNFDNYDVIMM